MRAPWILMSSRLALRLLCGTLLAMALLDVPVAVSPETGRVIGVLVLLVVLAGFAVLFRRRGSAEISLERTPRPARKDNRVAA